MIKGVFEVFKHTAAKETAEEKAAFLKQNETFALRTILQGCYHPGIKFLLPEGEPPFQLNDPVSVETRLHALVKKLDLFIEGGRPVANQSKREMLFIELLESVHPDDAVILIRMKDKKDPWAGMSHSVAHMAFPDLIPAPEVVPVEEPFSGVQEEISEPVPEKKKSARKKKVV